MRRLYTLLPAMLIGLAALCAPSHAHEMSVSILELQELKDGRFMMHWPTRRSAQTENLRPVLPEQCEIDLGMIDCAGEGLVGPLSFEGLGAQQSAAMFRIRYYDGQVQMHTVTAGQPVVYVTGQFRGEGWVLFKQVSSTYIQIGVEHILLGIDHLLFVLGLIWIVKSRWMLLKTITSFTVAHSITLAAVTFGIVGVPERLVNALIALSIVFIGVEIIKQHRGETSLTIRRPWIVAFGFGLLHGFGFANALMDLGLPESSLLAALLAFNVGVEIGQVAFVFLVLALGWALRVMSVHMPPRAQLMPAYLIGSLAALWTLQRVAMIVAA
ncbi:MAG: HupE/UreJ family protein [Pseudomonadota bacterium]